MTLKSIINDGAREAVRRMWIKRINRDGGYEADWFEISEYVVDWGSYSIGFGDDLYLGVYQIESSSIVLSNVERKFNDEKDSNSFFYRKRTRYGTKVKIQVCYFDSDDSEVEAFSWYGFMFGSPETSDSGEISIDVSSMLKVFQNYPASGIDTTSASLDTYITRLVTKEQGGVRLFDRYFEGDNDAERYSINPESATLITLAQLTISEKETVWDVIIRICQMCNYFVWVDDGSFVFTSKNIGATEQWKFNGAGSNNNDYGVDIVSISEYRDYNNVWTRAVVGYGENSEVVAQRNWTVGDGTFADVFGERTYDEIEEFDLSQSQAQAIADNVIAIASDARLTWSIDVKAIRGLSPKDKVQLNYIGELITENTLIYNVDNWELTGDSPVKVWGKRGGSISIDRQPCKIVNIEVDINNLNEKYKLVEA